MTGKRKILRSGFAALVLACALAAGLASAGPLEDALKAYSQRDYARALPLWRSLADQGNPFGQYYLGLMYERGQGTSRDSAQAAQWYRKAADQGDHDSQLSLGSLYDQGEGVEQNLVEAYKWLTLASEGMSDYQQREQHDAALTRRSRVAARMKPEQITEAEQLARVWKPKK